MQVVHGKLAAAGIFEADEGEASIVVRPVSPKRKGRVFYSPKLFEAANDVVDDELLVKTSHKYRVGIVRVVPAATPCENTWDVGGMWRLHV